MSLGMTMAGEEIEITFFCPCLVFSVMDCVYRIWIQSAEKVQESSLMIIQLTSYGCWYDTRRTQHHLCDSAAKKVSPEFNHKGTIRQTYIKGHSAKWLPGLFKGINVTKDKESGEPSKIDGDQRDSTTESNVSCLLWSQIRCKVAIKDIFGANGKFWMWTVGWCWMLMMM